MTEPGAEPGQIYSDLLLRETAVICERQGYGVVVGDEELGPVGVGKRLCLLLYPSFAFNFPKADFLV